MRINALAMAVAANDAAVTTSGEEEEEGAPRPKKRPIFLEAFAAADALPTPWLPSSGTHSRLTMARGIPLEAAVPLLGDEEGNGPSSETRRPIPPALCERDAALHIHIEGRFEDVAQDQWPTLTAGHFSPDCRTISNLGGSKHPRRAEDSYVAVGSGASAASKEWDSILRRIMVLASNQRDKKDYWPDQKSRFGFLLEQPKTPRASEHHHIKTMEQEVAAAAMAQKGHRRPMPARRACAEAPQLLDLRTRWGARLQTPDGRPKYKCAGKSSFHTHMNVRGKANQSVRFPPHLAWKLATGINRSYQNTDILLGGGDTRRVEEQVQRGA